MKRTILAAAIMALMACVFCQDRSPTFTCDGSREPNYDDCDTIVKGLEPNAVENFPLSYPDCQVVFLVDDQGERDHSLNCEFVVCPYDGNGDYYYEYSQVIVDYETAKANCQPKGAGGTRNDDSYHYSVETRNDPDYDPDSGPSKKRAVLPTHSHPRDLVTRQEESDDHYTLVVKSSAVEVPMYGKLITGRLTAGSSYMTTKGTSQTTGIETSASAEAGFFDIFSASVGVSVSFEETVSSTEGYTVVIDCDPGQYGELYWYPLFDVYEGFFTPSRTDASYYIPLDTDESHSNFHVMCLE